MGKTLKPRGKVPTTDPYARDKYEQAIADAIEFRKQNPTESFRKIALRFKPLHPDVIRNRFNSRSSRTNSGGHNKLLTDKEEQGIIDIIERYTLLRLNLLRSVAIRTLKKRGVEEPHVSKHWAERFVKRHPDLHTIKLKFLDQSCKMMHKKELLQEWFDLF
jgi:hypothetical protein